MIAGTALVFGDDVNTDLLHPSYFYSLDDHTVRQGFLGQVAGKEHTRGEDRARIVVAGSNFGCGSSRETTMHALRMAGVKALVAESFGRIFLRNATALGLPVFEVAGAAGFAEDGQDLRLGEGVLYNDATGRVLDLPPLDPYLQGLVDAGGLVAWLQRRGRIE